MNPADHLRQRKHECRHPVAARLLDIMADKQTCLAFSADVTSGSRLLALAETLGPEICVLKTHIDILTDFTQGLVQNLREIARAHQFLIFEDRKFADIGHTVKLQYQQGIYRIAEWADIINAHALPGPGIVEGLAESGQGEPRGLLLLASMSSAGNLFSKAYLGQTLTIAERFPETVMGFVAQERVSPDPGWIHFTPGIQFIGKGDSLGQRYITPDEAILRRKTDVIIVGRGILQSGDPQQEAKKYRAAGWKALATRTD